MGRWQFAHELLDLLVERAGASLLHEFLLVGNLLLNLIQANPLVVLRQKITYIGANAHAHSLFDRVTIKRKDDVDVPRSVGDYEVSVDEAGLPAGVTLIKRV